VSIMKVSFSCDNCKSPFTVDAQVAGRTGRCRHCGHRMVVPAASASPRPAVSAGGRPAAEPVAAAAASRPLHPRRVATAPAPQQQPVPPANRAMNWRDAVTSQLGLKPITEDALPALRSRREPEPDDEEPGSTYKLVIPRELRKEMEGRDRAPQVLRTGYAQGIKSYRQFFDLLARLSRWISKTSYSLSLVFLILAIAGGIVDQHSLAVFGLGAIVLLNIVGLAGDVVNLVMLSFRKNPIQGILFLVPPMTVIYLVTDWARYQKTIGRMIPPALMLCVAVLAYVFVPWLNGGKQDQATLGGRIEKAVESIKTKAGDSTSKVLKKAGEARDELRVQMDKGNNKPGEIDEKAKTKSDEGKPKDATSARGRAAEESNPGGAENPAPNRGP
jgi:DNA-directed RNA polymerase subunit RPC12/RpoP